MTTWSQWYSNYTDDQIEFVNEIISFLQNKLDNCKDDEVIKKRRLSIQLDALKYTYSIY